MATMSLQPLTATLPTKGLYQMAGPIGLVQQAQQTPAAQTGDPAQPAAMPLTPGTQIPQLAPVPGAAPEEAAFNSNQELMRQRMNQPAPNTPMRRPRNAAI
jgi:hypothetical protein